MPKLITTRTRIADLGKPRILIIGGGVGGPEVTKGLEVFKAQIVPFDSYNHHCFQPLLNQVITSGLETSPIIFPLRKRFENEDFFFRLGDVTNIRVFVRLISVIDFRSKLFVLFSWIWSYLSFDTSNRLIITRPKDGVN